MALKKIIEELDDENTLNIVSSTILADFFNKHGLKILEQRTISHLIGEFENDLVVRRIWFELFDGNSSQYIFWYEEAYDKKKVPRYENTILLILRTLIVGIIAEVVGVEYERNRDKIISTLSDFFKKSKGKLKGKLDPILSSCEKEIKYLFICYILRNYVDSRISEYGAFNYPYFKDIRKKIRDNIFNGVRYKIPEDILNYFNQYIKNHNLPKINDEFTSNLMSDVFLNIDFDELKKEHVKDDKIEVMIGKLYDKNITNISSVIHGFCGSPGFAIGEIKIIKTYSDCGKVNDSDIIVLHDLTPDMIDMITKISGMIVERGGTSHAAVIGRGRGIPVIVGVEKATSLFEDGMIVYFNASLGKIMILEGEA